MAQLANLLLSHLRWTGGSLQKREGYSLDLLIVTDHQMILIFFHLIFLGFYTKNYKRCYRLTTNEFSPYINPVSLMP